MTKSAMATPGLVLGHVSTVKMEGSLVARERWKGKICQLANCLFIGLHSDQKRQH